MIKPISFNEALHQHRFTYLALQSDLCPHVAVEHYRKIMLLSHALQNIAAYDGGVPRETMRAYDDGMEVSKKLMGKIPHADIAELVDDLEGIHLDISRLTTY